jgi:hypothetical protein
MERKAMKASGHMEGCPDEAKEPASTGYADIFCEGCNDWFDQPKILPNGTDIAWPADWSREKAQRWRAERNLTPPTGADQAAPPADRDAGSHD